MPAPLEREAEFPSEQPQEALAAGDNSSVQRAAGLSLPKPAKLPREAEPLAADTVRAPEKSGVGIKVDPSLRSGRLPSLPPSMGRFGRYEIIGRVAVGGMAEIFLSRETLPGGALRRCALKVLKRSAVSAEDERYFEELFGRECRTAVQLAHPNICHVYEFGKSAGRFFIAMEWIDGQPLSDVLNKLSQRGELLAPGMAVGIVAQVASALHYAHTARDARNRPLNVVHRDVNPQNIMIRHDGSVKLVDFGVAHVSEAEQDTRAETVKGKPAYMAPEQLMGGDLDGRVDVFALGVCLYEMLTGERLHKRDTIRETLTAVLREAPASLAVKRPGAPPALDELLRRALAKQAEQRFASAGDFQAALETFLTECGEIGSAREVAQLMERLYPGAKHSAPELDTSAEVVSYLTQSELSELAPRTPASARSARHVRMGALLLAGLLVAALTTYALWSSGPMAGTTQGPTAPRGQIAAERELVAPDQAARSAAPAPNEAATPAATPPTAPTKRVPARARPRARAPAIAPSSPKAPARDDNRPRKRARSPGFVADPGF